MDLSRIAIDQERATKGVWHTFWESPNGSDEPPAKFQVGRAGVDWWAAHARAMADVPDDAPYAVRAKALGPVLARLIHSWSGISENGKDLPYSRENAIQVCSNPEYEDLHVWLIDKGRSSTDYKKDVKRREAVQGN